jgi:Tfp pilus assembly ATPase PilU
MQTMNQALHNLYSRRHISYDDCISRSTDPDELIQMIQRSGGGAGHAGAQRR